MREARFLVPAAGRRGGRRRLLAGAAGRRAGTGPASVRKERPAAGARVGEGRRPAVGRERGGAPDPDLLGCGRRDRGSLREKAWRFQRSDGRAAFQNAVLRRIFWRWRWK